MILDVAMKTIIIDKRGKTKNINQLNPLNDIKRKREMFNIRQNGEKKTKISIA